jgi:hypothetical protein
MHLDFKDIPGTQSESQLAIDMDARVTASMWNLLSSNAGITSLVIYKLDGVSSAYTYPIAAFPAKWTGSGGADAILQGAAVLSIKSALRGKKWRNRTYLGPVAEAKQVDGLLDSATVATAQGGWNAFFANMITDGWQPVVISPSTGATGTADNAVQYLLRPYLRTQRRRARR